MSDPALGGFHYGDLNVSISFPRKPIHYSIQTRRQKQAMLHAKPMEGVSQAISNILAMISTAKIP